MQSGRPFSAARRIANAGPYSGVPANSICSKTASFFFESVIFSTTSSSFAMQSGRPFSAARRIANAGPYSGLPANSICSKTASVNIPISISANNADIEFSGIDRCWIAATIADRPSTFFTASICFFTSTGNCIYTSLATHSIQMSKRSLLLACARA